MLSLRSLLDRIRVRVQHPMSPGLAFVLPIAIGLCVATNASGIPRIADVDGTVRALVVYDGSLVAGGDFTQAGSTAASHVARWDGTQWNSLGAGTDAPVRALAVVGTDLVAGGDFTQAGASAANHVARWDGSAWSAMSAGTDSSVHALTTQSGVILYVGGNFTSAGGLEAHGVARWILGTWSALGAGLDGTVVSLTIAAGKLTACGDIVARDGLADDRMVVQFQQGAWKGQNRALSSFGGEVFAVHMLDASLAIGGRFQSVWWGPTPGFSVGRQVGTLWLPIGAGMWVGTDRDPADVHVLADYAGGLVAGGVFDRADGQVANNVAFFDSTRWNPLGDGVNGDVLALVEYRGALVAGGEFTEAGGAPAAHIAHWDGSSWLPDATPVTIEGLSAVSTPDLVRLDWRLPDAARRRIDAIVVQRATSALGPFAARSSRLVPAPRMSYEDAQVEPGALYWYRLRLDLDDGSTQLAGPVVVEAAAAGAAPTALLAAVDPGPGAPVQIRYRLAAPRQRVRLAIYDVRGQRVRLLEAGDRDPGLHVVTWDRRDEIGMQTGRGIYFVDLQAGRLRSTRKLALLVH